MLLFAVGATGQPVTGYLTVINTGAVEIHGVLLEPSTPVITKGLRCRLLSHPDGPQPFTLDTFSVIGPGAVVNCTNAYKITAEDMEVASTTLGIKVTGWTEDKAQSPGDFGSVDMNVASRLGLRVQLLHEQCEKPDGPGRCILAMLCCPFFNWQIYLQLLSSSCYGSRCKLEVQQLNHLLLRCRQHEVPS